jgi:hypothetical protein
MRCFNKENTMSENNFTSMKSTEGGFKNMKFRVQSPEQSEALQMKLLEMGYKRSNDTSRAQFISEPFIFTDKTGYIVWDDYENTFIEDDSQEMNTEEFINSGQPVKETGMTLREQLQQKVIDGWKERMEEAALEGYVALTTLRQPEQYVIDYFTEQHITWVASRGEGGAFWWNLD